MIDSKIFFNDYVPKMDPAQALPLPPLFVQALESLHQRVKYSVAKVCQDSIIYNKKLEIPQLNNLIFEVLSRNLKRDLQLAFWFEVKGTPEQFWLGYDKDTITDSTGRTNWKIDFAHTPPKKKFASLCKGVSHLGHAGVFINEASRILIDPLFFEVTAQASIEPINMNSIGNVDAVFFTHYHSDHFELSSLTQIPLHTPIYVPSRGTLPFAPDMKRLLNTLGFSTVYEVRIGERINLLSGASVDILPFFGEARELVGFEAYCPLYNGPERRILFHADSGPNFQGQSILDSVELINNVQKFGSIDTVFGSWWQGQDLMLNLSPFILLSEQITSKKWLNTVENCNCTVDYLAALFKKIGAQRFVTYAERSADTFYPEEIQDAYIPLTSFFWKRRKQCANEIQAQLKIEILEAIPRKLL